MKKKLKLKQIIMIILLCVTLVFIVLSMTKCRKPLVYAEELPATEINLNDYVYKIPHYIQYDITNLKRIYNITSGEYSYLYIMNDAYNYIDFYDNDNVYYFMYRFSYTEYSATSYSLSLNLYIYDNFYNVGSTTNYFAVVYYYANPNTNVLAFSSMSLKTTTTTNQLKLDRILVNGVDTKNRQSTMTIGSVNYIRWVSTYMILQPKANDAYYNAGVQDGFTSGKEAGKIEVQQNPHEYNLYNYTDLEEYGQEQYNAGMETTETISTTWFLKLFSGISQIFSIRLMGSLTLGAVVLIPFAISLTWFIVKSFRGGD